MWVYILLLFFMLHRNVVVSVRSAMGGRKEESARLRHFTSFYRCGDMFGEARRHLRRPCDYELSVVRRRREKDKYMPATRVPRIFMLKAFFCSRAPLTSPITDERGFSRVQDFLFPYDSSR